VSHRPVEAAPGSGGGESSIEHLRAAEAQLAAYLRGELQDFDLTLDLRAGSDFDQKVWAATRRIPYGAVLSYGQLAAEIGLPGGARAVGGALGRNPVLVVVPCHRVLRAGGGLGGFGAGLPLKRALLAHEGYRSAALIS
jgi:methylated-DNA-[protein]-cysteine S-methyltransferase